MASPNEIIQNLLNTAPKSDQGPTVEGMFEIDRDPSLNRIANNGKLLTQNISRLTQALKVVFKGWEN